MQNPDITCYFKLHWINNELPDVYLISYFTQTNNIKRRLKLKKCKKQDFLDLMRPGAQLQKLLSKKVTDDEPKKKT